MLHLRNDLYSRLVISTHKNRALNQQFKKSIYSSNWTENINSEISGKLATSKNTSSNIVGASSNTTTVTQNDEGSEFEKKLLQAAGVIRSSDSNITGDSSFIKSRITPNVKIDEKVELSETELSLDAIKLELEVAEQLLSKIKSNDPYNQKIPVLERTVSRLKAIIVQKMAS